jgi:hypothetical protein
MCPTSHLSVTYDNVPTSGGHEAGSYPRRVVKITAFVEADDD